MGSEDPPHSLLVLPTIAAGVVAGLAITRRSKLPNRALIGALAGGASGLAYAGVYNSSSRWVFPHDWDSLAAHMLSAAVGGALLGGLTSGSARHALRLSAMGASAAAGAWSVATVVKFASKPGVHAIPVQRLPDAGKDAGFSGEGVRFTNRDGSPISQQTSNSLGTRNPQTVVEMFEAELGRAFPEVAELGRPYAPPQSLLDAAVQHASKPNQI